MWEIQKTMKDKDSLIERAYEIMDRIKTGPVYKIDLNVLNLIESMIKRIQRLKSENKTGDNNEPPTKNTD